MSVTAPLGVTAAGIAAGIKPDGMLDLALIVTDEPATAAAVFTTNLAAAAPVQLSRRHVSGGVARAVVLNSGCANAATGPSGDLVAIGTARAAAKVLGCKVTEVLVCSTGTIGDPLDGPTVAAGVGAASAQLERSPAAGKSAARAIMTTDSGPKETLVEFGGFTVGGMAKGAGMIRPDMATMLAVIVTDAVASAEDLSEALRSATEVSFNCLDIDGCASTNDTVITVATGASGVTPDREALTSALTTAAKDLARQIAEDAEGASRLVTLHVKGAVDAAAAKVLGRAMCDSALVRSAFYGGDPNWGRLLSACGEAGIPFDPTEFSVSYQGVLVADEGISTGVDRADLRSTMETGDLDVVVGVGAGPGDATLLTTDLTPQYVEFNAEYS